jgi:hypothetical protein
MKCSHCLVEFHAQRNVAYLGKDVEGDWAVEQYLCPNPKCRKFVFFLVEAEIGHGQKYFIKKDALGHDVINQREQIRPKGSTRPPVPNQVPKDIARDYTEAGIVLPDSPKASAALSRRALQHLLRDIAQVKPGNLANEIQQVLDSNQMPSYMTDSIDAIRNIGNFAAHPSKSSSTGEIVEVEPGEAEWNLEVLEMLFDFYYVQPDVIRSRREALNKKLEDSGKYGMK